jgi:hypothetical protein
MTDEEKKTDPGNRGARKVLRVVGPVVMVSGMPLFFVGRILHQFGCMD